MNFLPAISEISTTNNALAVEIQKMADIILDHAILLAAIGTLAMAILELFKGLFLARRVFHRYMIKTHWLNEDQAALNELLDLAIGGVQNDRAFYDQPSEKMLGQLQAAVNVVLDHPKMYSHFYKFLTKETAPRMAAQEHSDGDLWLDYKSEKPGVRKTIKTDEQQAIFARQRLGNLVARRLDALQTRIEYRWARGNQTLSIILGACFSAYALTQVEGVNVSDTGRLPMVIVTSLFAGMLSPFAKDVVSALSGLSTKRG